MDAGASVLWPQVERLYTLMCMRANSPGTRLLVKQLRQFPTGDHDDGLGDRLWLGV